MNILNSDVHVGRWSLAIVDIDGTVRVCATEETQVSQAVRKRGAVVTNLFSDYDVVQAVGLGREDMEESPIWTSLMAEFVLKHDNRAAVELLEDKLAARNKAI